MLGLSLPLLLMTRGSFHKEGYPNIDPDMLRSLLWGLPKRYPYFFDNPQVQLLQHLVLIAITPGSETSKTSGRRAQNLHRGGAGSETVGFIQLFI